MPSAIVAATSDSLPHQAQALSRARAFAEPLLVEALRDQFKVELDVHTTLLSLKQPLEWGIQGTDVGTYEVLRLPLLQAALHNFEASETEPNAFHESSGFVQETAGSFTAVDTPLTVAQFTQLCRSLDMGAKYQAYLKDFLKPADGVARQALRLPFIDAQAQFLVQLPCQGHDRRLVRLDLATTHQLRQRLFDIGLARFGAGEVDIGQHHVHAMGGDSLGDAGAHLSGSDDGDVAHGVVLRKCSNWPRC